eukprot:403342232
MKFTQQITVSVLLATIAFMTFNSMSNAQQAVGDYYYEYNITNCVSNKTDAYCRTQKGQPNDTVCTVVSWTRKNGTQAAVINTSHFCMSNETVRSFSQTYNISNNGTTNATTILTNYTFARYESSSAVYRTCTSNNNCMSYECCSERVGAVNGSDFRILNNGTNICANRTSVNFMQYTQTLRNVSGFNYSIDYMRYCIDSFKFDTKKQSLDQVQTSTNSTSNSTTNSTSNSTTNSTSNSTGTNTTSGNSSSSDNSTSTGNNTNTNTTNSTTVPGTNSTNTTEEIDRSYQVYNLTNCTNNKTDEYCRSLNGSHKQATCAQISVRLSSSSTAQSGFYCISGEYAFAFGSLTEKKVQYSSDGTTSVTNTGVSYQIQNVTNNTAYIPRSCNVSSDCGAKECCAFRLYNANYTQNQLMYSNGSNNVCTQRTDKNYTEADFRGLTNFTSNNFRGLTFQYSKYCNDWFELDNETMYAQEIPRNDDQGNYKLVSCASNKTDAFCKDAMRSPHETPCCTEVVINNKTNSKSIVNTTSYFCMNKNLVSQIKAYNLTTTKQVQVNNTWTTQSVYANVTYFFQCVNTNYTFLERTRDCYINNDCNTPAECCGWKGLNFNGDYSSTLLLNGTKSGNQCLKRPEQNESFNVAQYSTWNWYTKANQWKLTQAASCNDRTYWDSKNNTYYYREQNFTEPGYPEPTGPVQQDSPFFVRSLFNLTTLFVADEIDYTDYSSSNSLILNAVLSKLLILCSVVYLFSF